MDTWLRHFILRSSIVPVLISRWLFGGNAAAPFRTLMHDDLTAHHNNLVINSVRLSGYRLSFRHPCLAINETIENVIGTIEVELRSTARRLYQTHPADAADHKKIEKYTPGIFRTLGSALGGAEKKYPKIESHTQLYKTRGVFLQR